MATISDLARFAFTAVIGLQTIVLASGCGVPDDPELSQTDEELSVASATGASCSTATVLGLSKQIAEEVNCESHSLARFTAGHGIRFTNNAVLPYLAANGRADLLKVAHGGVVRVNSGYRTVAQQYLLYRWYREGRCGIAIAARPGTSNHESARAVDLANWAARESAMVHHGWAHDVPGDVVHFDHLSSRDIRGEDVRAFQRLWNRNHPHDRIGVDGSFGPATARRLRRAPAKGFAKGASCHAPRMLEVRAIAGPDRIAPGETAVYEVAIANDSDTDWPSDAQLVASNGQVIDVPALEAGGQATVELAVSSQAEGAVDTTVSLLSSGGTVDDFTVSTIVRAADSPAEISVEALDDNDAGDGADADDDGAVP